MEPLVVVVHEQVVEWVAWVRAYFELRWDCILPLLDKR